MSRGLKDRKGTVFQAEGTEDAEALVVQCLMCSRKRMLVLLG